MKRCWLLVAILGLSLLGRPTAHADKLQDALDALTAARLFSTLALDEGQLRQCLALVDAVQRAQADFERQQGQTLATAARALADKWQAVIRGEQTDPKLEQAIGQVLAETVYNERVHDQAVERLVLSLRNVLSGQQNGLIDWGKPAAQGEEEHLATGEDEALRYSLHIYALQTIDRARSLGGQYQARRIEVANDYLAAVAPPGTPLYDQLLPYVLDVFRRARLMTWLEWLQYRDVLADQLGQIIVIGQEQPPPASRPFNLKLVRQVLESPVTADVLQEMLAAARAPR